MNFDLYVKLADGQLNSLFGGVEGEVGDKEIANKTLRHFYKEAINMSFFIRSTGKEGEYKAFMDRFRKKFPNAEKTIQSNVELEEINVELEGVDELVADAD